VYFHMYGESKNRQHGKRRCHKTPTDGVGLALGLVAWHMVIFSHRTYV
jgi:hypothetical protein